MEMTEYKSGTPTRNLQEENLGPTSSRNRFRVLGKLRPRLPAMLHFEREQAHKRKRKKLATFYEIHEQPILILTFILSLQHFMTVQGMTALQPKLMSKFLCTDEGNPAIGRLVGSASFVSGIGTLLQTTAGVRLPVVQSGALGLASPALAELKFDLSPCPENSTPDDEIWMSRMLNVQASIAVGAATELVMGAMGVVGVFQRWVTPLTMTPAIALIGLSSISAATEPASTSWTIAVITAALITLLSQYLTPCRPASELVVVKKLNDGITFLSIVPIFVTVLIVWLACHVLTVKDVFPEDHAGRTDHLASAIGNTTWFRVPLPFQWGTPTLSWESAVTTVFVSIMNMMETVCDYYAYAVVSGLPPPPPRAINRGIFMEGLGCLLAACFGSGVLCGIQDINIGLLAVTKCASLRVVQVAAGMMVLFGLMTKASVVALSVPAPILGGLLLVLLATIAGVGLAQLRYVDLTSSRNVFIVGVSLTLGIIVPLHVGPASEFAMTQVKVIDRVIYAFFSTGSLIGGFVGCLLDHTIPGTEDERGILKLRECFSEAGARTMVANDPLRHWQFYSVPCFDKMLRRFPVLRKLPVMPEREPHVSYLEDE
ncbi:solute carrier family 23 member 2-like [Amblyomma americanum]